MTSSIDTTKSSGASTIDSNAPDRQRVPSSAHEEIYEGLPIPLHSKLYRGATASLRILPDFLIIGTQRGGTTSLYRYLKAHPYFAAPSYKDVHFFDRRYRKGLLWYRGHFPTVWEKAYAQQILRRPFLTGEASPSYLFHPYAPQRVAQALPHVKLIALLRNPVSRAYSQYHHAVELGFETLSIEEAFRDEQERTAREREKILKDEYYYTDEYKHRSYLTKGIYVDQLQAWMRVIPREQFLILKSEDLYKDPAATFKRVLAFLNLPETELAVEKQDYKQYNTNTYSSKIDSTLRTRLVEYFKPHNARLYEFLGVDFGWDK